MLYDYSLRLTWLLQWILGGGEKKFGETGASDLLRDFESAAVQRQNTLVGEQWVCGIKYCWFGDPVTQKDALEKAGVAIQKDFKLRYNTLSYDLRTPYQYVSNRQKSLEWGVPSKFFRPLALSLKLCKILNPDS